MMMNRIIMICGAARCGKDTIIPFLIDNLKSKYGGNWMRYAFADRIRKDLKQVVYEKYNVDINDDSKKHLFRQDMIEYGENKRRETSGMFFIDDFIDNHDINYNYIISDFRFINEYYYLNQHFTNIEIIPIYIQRSLNSYGLKFQSIPSIPQEIENYSEIIPVCQTIDIPWFDDHSWIDSIKEYCAKDINI